jgi:two-component system, response regulator
MDEKIILLVEDNPDEEELVRIALQQTDVMSQLIVVHHGAEALDYLFSTGTYAGRGSNMTPHLILLDLKMPKVHGLEVLRKLRADERTKLVPVVILTSSNEEQDLLASYSLGANSYVCKPVDFVQFTELVIQLELYWLVLNERLPRSPRKRLDEHTNPDLDC